MLKDILYPNKGNLFIWINAGYLILLMSIGFVPPITVVFAYFLESIVVGLLNIVKMTITTLFGRTQKADNHPSIAHFQTIFFAIHYGGFVAIQSIFAFVLFEMDQTSVITNSLDLMGNYLKVLHFDGMGWVMMSIIAQNVGYFINNFIIKEKYHQYRAADLMMKPYVRIFVQQFVVIIAAFFVIFYEAGIMAAILLILFRTCIDLMIVAFKEDARLTDLVAHLIKKDEQDVEEVRQQLQQLTE
ncbi:DUF6498-containing protein [uncultured Dokdonia sp.]|uniref:DUF6498-containing protein n=1 Tax=uncultured Dokdonia sp. TaxID=575653 RepID=UPI00260FC951|nr:DUF6498-containing protein [uncultured Dokdonia sp.]